MDEKTLTSIKFLELIKEHALAQRDLAVPYDRPDLFTAKRYVLGLLIALTVSGYEIKEKVKEIGIKS